MDEVEAQLRSKVVEAAGAVRSVLVQRAQPLPAHHHSFRGVLREAVQRRELAEYDLDRYLAHSTRAMLSR